MSKADKAPDNTSSSPDQKDAAQQQVAGRSKYRFGKDIGVLEGIFCAVLENGHSDHNLIDSRNKLSRVAGGMQTVHKFSVMRLVMVENQNHVVVKAEIETQNQEVARIIDEYREAIRQDGMDKVRAAIFAFRQINPIVGIKLITPLADIVPYFQNHQIESKIKQVEEQLAAVPAEDLKDPLKDPSAKAPAKFPAKASAAAVQSQPVLTRTV